MRHRAIATLIACLVSATAAAEEARPGHTLVLHHGHDAVSREARLVHPLPSSAPTSRVMIAAPGTRMRGPVVDASGRVYVGTTNGLTLVEADGHAARDVVVGALDAPPVLIPGGDVVVLARDGSLARVSSDGRVLVRARTVLGVRFAPLVRDDGSLLVVAASRTLAEVGSDLVVRRERELPDGLALGPIETARGHYAIAAGAELAIVEPVGLQLLRAIPLPGRAATPAVSAPDGSLWLATVDGELIRVRGELRIADTITLGARLPEPATSDRAMLAIAPDGDVLVVIPSRGLVRIASSGEERWTWASDSPLIGAFTVDTHGRAAVSDRTGHLSVIDDDGTRLWMLSMSALPLGPAITTPQGRIVIATDQGLVLLGPS